jgi:pSer/pThr/pTyr-binding forkhead associated (FHA) protein
VPASLSKQVSQQVPIFKIAADQGTHPPVGLDRPVCVVGRHDYANLPLPAKAVSKLHALIVREQRRVYLRDLASTNGVDVNGAAVRETELSDADVIRIGAFTLRCQSGGGKDGVRPAGDNGSAAVDGDGARPPQAELRSAAGNVSFPPGRHTLLIGQREGCEVRLKHESILPVHAVIFELDGKHYIQAFAPEYATRVNGKPVHREPLQPGDELRIGSVTLRYALVDLAADSVAQPASAMADSSGGTGDSLITPVLDSSIAPAITPAADDPAHHGELMRTTGLTSSTPTSRKSRSSSRRWNRRSRPRLRLRPRRRPRRQPRRPPRRRKILVWTSSRSSR